MVRTTKRNSPYYKGYFDIEDNRILIFRSSIKDIRDYVETRQTMLDFYKNFWTIYRKNFGNIYRYWVLYDIYTYIIKNNDSLRDSQIIQNIEIEYINFAHIKTRKKLNSRIKTLWGLLLPNERNNFIIQMHEENIIPK
jgi:hypothetical protein